METFEHFYYITEGGAYGHMSHMYEDTDLTFGQLKELTTGLFNKSIKADFKEKTDGQALSVTIKPNDKGNLTAFFARNKGHQVNGARSAMTLEALVDKFSGRGSLSEAFTFAAIDISKALEGLDRETLEKVFLANEGDGKGRWGYRWLNVEILWPDTINVIPYDTKKLIIHNYTEHDNSGNMISTDFNKTAEYVVNELGEQGLATQKNFIIDYMPLLDLNEIEDADEKVNEYIEYFDNLQSKYKLSNSDTIGDLYETVYTRHIKRFADKIGYNIPTEVLDGLLNRWVYNINKPNIRDLKKYVTNPDFEEWITQQDRTESKTKFNKSVKNLIKIPFIQIAIDILDAMSNLWMVVDPELAKAQIIDRIKNTVSHFKELKGVSDDDEEQAIADKINDEMGYIENSGGLHKIIPSEGLTFFWNDKVYKMTGTFAPVNQILGKEPGKFASKVSTHTTKSHGKRHNLDNIRTA